MAVIIEVPATLIDQQTREVQSRTILQIDLSKLLDAMNDQTKRSQVIEEGIKRGEPK